MQRRTFVTGLAASFAAGAIPSLPARRLTRIGLELYTVRAEMRRDPDRTLADVARIGYTDVELLWSMGNFGRSTAEVRAALDKNGLRAPSCHMSAAAVLVGWERSLDIAKQLGHEYLIVPSFTADTDRSLDDWREWADKFNKAGEIARRAGVWLAFHNEPDHMKPIGGQVPYDVFVERTDPALVRLQLDVGNMALGGGDPVRYLERWPNRYWSFHIKDVLADNSGDTELGKGRLDFRRLLSRVPDIDKKPCYVEQEGSRDSLASAKLDYAYLKALDF